jgi:hypothetical protein
MTIQKEIVIWAASRPAWQQTALSGLAAGKEWDAPALAALVSEIKGGRSVAEVITEAAIPVATSTTATVSLRAIRDLKNVNALVPAQDLLFAASGLTVIYGDNGSGKSGYARLVKSAVRSLHHEEVHRNVFASEPGEQHAEIIYNNGSKDEPVSWPTKAPVELNAVSFYDEACGDAYLEKESELGYRPSALVLLDGLIELCDRVAAAIDAELQANALKAGGLPDVPDETKAAVFLATLSGKTTATGLDAACALDPDSDEELNRLRQEEARLLGSSPDEEIARLAGFAEEMRALALRIEKLDAQLSDVAAQNVQALHARALAAREAAMAASSASFGTEPLKGVGSETWRILWAAARDYSTADAYPDAEFPVVVDAHCLLCQQPLGSEAADRLRRFDTFVRDTTARQADEAERDLAGRMTALRDLAIEPPKLGAARASLHDSDASLASRAEGWLEAADTRRLALLGSLGDEPDRELPGLDLFPRVSVEDLAAAADAAATRIDAQQYKDALGQMAAQRKEIEGSKALADQRAKLESEISRLGAREGLEAARRETDTKGITRKATELTENTSPKKCEIGSRGSPTDFISNASGWRRLAARKANSASAPSCLGPRSRSPCARSSARASRPPSVSPASLARPTSIRANRLWSLMIR